MCICPCSLFFRPAHARPTRIAQASAVGSRARLGVSRCASATQSCTARRTSRSSQGASHPDELVLRAAELGYAALAVTDVNSLAGVVRAHGAAKQLGLKLLIGAEITPQDAPPVVLVGNRSRQLRPAVAADHTGPPSRRQGRVSARVRGPGRRLRRTFGRRGAAGSAECGSAELRSRRRFASATDRALRRSLLRPGRIASGAK